MARVGTSDFAKPYMAEWAEHPQTGHPRGVSLHFCLHIYHSSMTWGGEVAYCFWRWEWHFERKGIRGFAMGTQVGEMLFCLFDCRNVTRGHPAEDYIRAIETLKPLLALLQYLS